MWLSAERIDLTVIIQSVLLLALVLAAATRLCTAVLALRHRRPRLLLSAGLALLAAGQLLSLPPVAEWADATTTAGADKVAYNVTTMAGLLALVIFFIRATHRQIPMRLVIGHVAVFVAVAATMGGLMIATPRGMRHHWLQAPFIAVAPVAAFYIVGNLYFVYAYFSCAQYVVRYNAKPGSNPGPLMRLSLRLITGAAVALIATSLGREGWVLARVWGLPAPELVNWLNWQTEDLAFLLLAAALSLLAAVDIAVAITLVRRRIRQYHEMMPLWAALKRVYPEIVVRWRWPTGGYYRRVAECFDGLTRLRPYIVTAAVGIDLSNCEPQELARYASVALQMKRLGTPAVPTTTQLPIPHDHNQAVAWLIELAESFHEHQSERLPA